MNIGIILYSQTGNTRSVAEKLKDKLASQGHSVTLEEIAAEGDLEPGGKVIRLTAAPQTARYDAIVFAAQVQAFSLSSVMKAYMRQTGPLEGKPAGLLVTKHLPFYWTGGNAAVRYMKKTVKARGGRVAGTEIIIWSNKNRESMIEHVTDRLSKALTSVN